MKFWKSYVQTSTWTPAVVSAIYFGFLQSFDRNCRQYLKIGHDLLVTRIFYFIMHSRPNTRSYITSALKHKER